MSAANHAFLDGFDKNGRKINNNGGDEIDYRYDDDGNIISSTAVEIRYSKTSERDFRMYGLKMVGGGGGLYDPTWDILGGAVSFGKLFSGLKLLFAAKSSGAGKYLFNNWHKGTFANRTQSVSYHLAKHGKGRTATQYTRDAMSFFSKNKGLGQNVILKNGIQGIKIQTKQIINGKTHRVGGYWTKDGKIVTFWD